jgi:hypothetical protein
VATSALPDLIDALVTGARAALPDTLVYDGFGVDAEPGHSYLMVGVDDVDARDSAYAATATQEWANANYTARDEEGYVVCAALAWNGDSDAKAARDEAFTTVAAVENLCRANPSLGVTSLLWTSFGGRVQLSQNQSEHGATAIVIFQINYRARI